MKKFLFPVSITMLISTSPSMSQSVDYNSAYNILKTHYFSQIMESCSQGRKFNSIGKSYWDTELKQERDDKMLAGTRVSQGYLNIYNSAFTQLMRENCPEVW